jgi:hypothetical protein
VVRERRAVPRCVNKPRSTWLDYHVNLGVRPAQGLAATDQTKQEPRTTYVRK